LNTIKTREIGWMGSPNVSTIAEKVGIGNDSIFIAFIMLRKSKHTLPMGTRTLKRR